MFRKVNKESVFRIVKKNICTIGSTYHLADKFHVKLVRFNRMFMVFEYYIVSMHLRFIFEMSPIGDVIRR